MTALTTGDDLLTPVFERTVISTRGLSNAYCLLLLLCYSYLYNNFSTDQRVIPTDTQLHPAFPFSPSSFLQVL